MEYAAAACLSLSVLYYFTKYFYIWFAFKPVQGTPEQRRLLHFNEGGKFHNLKYVFVHAIYIAVFVYACRYLVCGQIASTEDKCTNVPTEYVVFELAFVLK